MNIRNVFICKVVNIFSKYFGSKYSDQGTPVPSMGNSVAFNNDGSEIAVVHTNSSRISAYAYSAGFGTKRFNPGTPIVSNGYSVALL